MATVDTGKLGISLYGMTVSFWISSDKWPSPVPKIMAVSGFEVILSLSQAAVFWIFVYITKQFFIKL